MVTCVTPVPEQQHMPRAQARAGRQDAHVRLDFVAYLDPSTSTTQLANETPDQSHIEDRKRAGEYCCNQQYSVTAITTSTGTIAERYAYSAYGQPTILDASGSILNASAISNRYTYTGREWDATLGLHYFRARWVSPSAGRFLGRDPIGYVDTQCLYEYARGGVVTLTDASGLISIKHVSNDFDKFKKCAGASREIQWSIELSDTAENLCPKTKAGYMVQEVSVTCRDAQCDSKGNCDSINASIKEGSYFEYWFVQGASKVWINQTANGVTDSATGNPHQNDNCGHYTQAGHLKFFCSDTVDPELPKAVRPASESNCNTSSGRFSGWNSMPMFWDSKSDDGDVSRHFSMTWTCCKCNKANMDVASGNPK